MKNAKTVDGIGNGDSGFVTRCYWPVYLVAIQCVSAEIFDGVSIHLLRPSPDQTIRPVTVHQADLLE